MIELIGFENEYIDLLNRYESNNLPNSILIHGLSGIGKRTLLNKLVKNIINIEFKDNNVKIIFGGNERSISSFKALKFIKKYNPKNVFIHDAARPNFSLKLLHKLYKGLKKNKCVVPYLTSNNSL